MCSSKDNKTIKYTELERKILAKKLSIDNMNECINQYASLSILYVSKSKEEITLL